MEPTADSGQSLDQHKDQLLGALRWRLLGPHRGGRVSAVAGDPIDQQTFYFGACAGGVWKTTNGGISWQCISDGYFNTSAIGALTVSPSSPNVIYAGTGEAALRGNISHGDGIYKSTNSGRSWTNIGLSDTRHINDIVIHPENPDVVFVSALGHAWGENSERGIFRTTDGGNSWEQVLYIAADVGGGHLAIDPSNPSIVFASMWQAQRGPHFLTSGGNECKLYRSEDGGDSWIDVSAKPGFATGLLGKIGVAVSPAQPGRVWALVEALDGALYRSEDYGDSWERISDFGELRRRPYYYFNICADPTNPDTLWVPSVSCWKSSDGGYTFAKVPTPHNDNHAIWIDPEDSRRMIIGNDGGACVSFTGGSAWSSLLNQPTAQFYHVTTDDRFPYRVYGSQQDNTAISLPSASTLGAITPSEWVEPGGGESGYIAVRSDNNTVVAGSIGSGLGNGRLTHYDYRTQQIRNITPWPEVNSTAAGGSGADELKYRFQWTFPISYSKHEPDTLFIAGNHLFRSTDEGTSWDIVSPDLTRNDPTKLGASGGPITRCNSGVEVYCTIFAFAESPHVSGEYWVGTDDGLVHLSRNGGETWTAITPQDLPEWSLISMLEVSPHTPGTAYLAATRYKLDDNRPYLFKTDDYGASWTDITGGIPDDDFTRAIREDPDCKGLLFVGTETGIYCSFDAGLSWSRLGGNLPVTPIHDFVIKNGDLVVATHGRSFWILDDISPLRQLTVGGIEPGLHLFPPRDTVRFKTYGGHGRSAIESRTGYRMAGPYVISYSLERDRNGSLHEHLLDAGENPPSGVSIWFALDHQPGDELRLLIRDAHGQTIRQFSSTNHYPTDNLIPEPILPASQGLNLFMWDLRHAGSAQVPGVSRAPWESSPGPLVVPGSYQLELNLGDEVRSQTLQVLPDPRVPATEADLQEQLALLLLIRDTLTEVNRAVVEVRRLQETLHLINQRLQHAHAEHDFLATIEQTSAILNELEGELIQVNMDSPLQFPTRLSEKLDALSGFIDSADAAPTRQSEDVAQELVKRAQTQIDRLVQLKEERLPEINAHLHDRRYPILA